MRTGLVVIFLSVLFFSAPSQARDQQCPALLTDAECDSLVNMKSRREVQPEEYSNQILHFSRLMSERQNACQCDDRLLMWAGKMQDFFNAYQRESPSK